MGKLQTEPRESRDAEAAVARQRLDLWLWHARVGRTRPLAAKLVSSGHVRINSQRNRSPGKPIKLGDVLTIGLDQRVLVLRINGFAQRREAYSQARLLYDDLSDPGEDRSQS